MKNFLVIISIFLLIGLILTGGCVTQPAEEVFVEEPDPGQVLNMFINALENLDLEIAKSYLSSGYSEEFERDFEELAMALKEEGVEAEAIREMFFAIFANSDFNVTGHTVTGDTALVGMENTMPDMEQLGELLMGRLFEVILGDDIDFENLTEDEEIQLFVGIFTEVISEAEKVVTAVEVPMVKEDGQWKIDGSVVDEVMGEIEF